MCKVTKNTCLDCKSDYYEINDDSCWKKIDYNPIFCLRMTLNRTVGLGEGWECARCKREKETHWLRFSRPPGLIISEEGRRERERWAGRKEHEHGQTTLDWGQRVIKDEREYAEMLQLQAVVLRHQHERLHEELERQRKLAGDAAANKGKEEYWEDEDGQGRSIDVPQTLEPDFTMELWGGWVFTWTAPWRSYKFWRQQRVDRLLDEEVILDMLDKKSMREKAETESWSWKTLIAGRGSRRDGIGKREV